MQNIDPVKKDDKSDLKLADVNARVAIAFGIAMILPLLTYIAFFK